MSGPELKDDYWVAGLWTSGGPPPSNGAPPSHGPVVEWDMSVWAVPGGPFLRDGDKVSYLHESGEELGLVDLEVYSRNGLRWYSGIWDGLGAGHDSIVREDLTEDSLKRSLELEEDGLTYHLVDFERYTTVTSSDSGEDKEQVRFAGLWHPQAISIKPTRLVSGESLDELDPKWVLDLEVTVDSDGVSEFLALERARSKDDPDLDAVFYSEGRCGSTEDQLAHWNRFHYWFHHVIGNMKPSPHEAHEAAACFSDPSVDASFNLVELEYHPKIGFVALARQNYERDPLIVTDAWTNVLYEMEGRSAPLGYRLIDLELGLPPIPAKAETSMNPDHSAFHGHGSEGDP